MFKTAIKEIENMDFKLLVMGAIKNYEDAHGRLKPLGVNGQIAKRLDRILRDVILQKLKTKEMKWLRKRRI